MSHFINFFNSNFFIGLVTFIAGLAAFIVYFKRKNDSKKNVANIILLEIQYAERILDRVRPELLKDILPNVILLPTESWSKYKYLFVGNFDRDEWDSITDFYNYCRFYDEAVGYNNSMFQKNEEQIRINLYQTTNAYFREYIDSQSDQSGKLPDVLDEQKKEIVVQKAKKFQEVAISNASLLFNYSPTKPIIDAKNALSNLNQKMSLTTIGSKFKRIAKIQITNFR